jgi:hypothetical protein
MLSDLAFYKIALVLILATWNLYFIFSLMYRRLAPYRLALLITLIAIAAIVRVFLANPVYIIGDNNEVQKRVLVIPHKYALSNGQYTILKPKPGLSNIWLVNNGNKSAWYELVVYGENQESSLDRSLIAPFSSAEISQIDAIFEAPPETIRAIKLPATLGWLHR